MKTKKEKARLYPGRFACLILKSGLPAVLAVLVWIVICLYRGPSVTDPGMIGECREMLQIALTCLCIVLGGALYGDVLEKRGLREE